MAHGGNIAALPWHWEKGLQALGLLALPLGVLGFWQYDLGHEGHGTLLDWLYYTLQLFVLHGVHLDPPVPWCLHLARFLAPVFTLYGLLWSVMQVFQEPFRALHLWRIRQHVLLIGDGALALRLATDLCADGRRVVTVGSAARQDAFLALPRQCLYLPSDLATALPWHTLRVQTSQQIILATEDDQSNIGTAVQLVQFYKENTPQATVPPCHVHLFGFFTRELFTRYRLSESHPEAKGLTTFNIYDTCARDVLERYPLDRQTIGPDSPLVVRLVVLGFGKMGESLVLQAAKLGHFAHGRRLEIVVLDREAEEREASFLSRYPHFRAICDIEFQRQDISRPQTVQALAQLLEDQQRLQTLAFCLNDATVNMPILLGLSADLHRHNVPALVRTTAAGGLEPLLDTLWDGVPLKQLLHPFTVLASSVSQSFLAGARQDALARAIHADFLERRRREGRRADDPAMQLWEALGPDLKASNRRQADHITVKLRAVGCSTSSMRDGPSPSLQPFQGFSPEEVEILTQMEHASWNAERFLAGWQYGCTRNERDRLSPYLVSWEALPEEARERDREAVRNIPPLLGRIGESISR